MYYLHCKVVHVIIYKVKGRYAFRSYLYNYFFSHIKFFNQSVSQKKIVKVIEDDINGKLFEIYKETEKGHVS